jgi:hypothetical protein
LAAFHCCSENDLPNEDMKWMHERLVDDPHS